MADASHLLADLFRYLQAQRELGVEQVPRLDGEVLRHLRTGKITMAQEEQKPLFEETVGTPTYEGSDASADDVATALEKLDNGQVKVCTKCKLCETRTNTVFGAGDPKTRLMFVGEGPGQDEDEQGLPFVGKSGQKLTDIIEKGMRISRSDVYIANMVKCRPPGNRNPNAGEVEACRSYLEEQIDLIRPEFICTLGNVPSQFMIGKKIPMREMRGKFFPYRDTGILVMPTYHPAYLLRNPNSKRLIWEDIQGLMRKMGMPIPKRDG